jgi:serine phosphatase RsbU (regulator of sigma subunit)
MELSPNRQKLTVWNCCMTPVLIFRNGKIQHRLDSSFFARGVLPELDGPGIEIDTQPGDRIIASTDGFVEEMDINGKMFGQEKFEKILTEIIAQGKPLEFLR